MKDSFQRTIDLEVKRLEKERVPKDAELEELTQEGIDTLLETEASFVGSKQDISALERHEQLKRTAQLLHVKSSYVKAWQAEEPNRRQPNAAVSIDIGRIAYFKDDEKQRFSLMLELADSVTVASMEDSARFSFIVKDVWREDEL